MFSTSTIIDNLNQDKGVEYKKLCRKLKISKKADKDKLTIALSALEKLEIINKNEDNEYLNVKDSNHLIAKIRCSSKGFCFAIRDNCKEDIYIKENLLNYAWNGDKVLVRIIKDGYRRRSPEGIVDCILERSNQILLARVEKINNQVYAVPIDDRILAKIKLPSKDEKFLYVKENKNIVKVEIDMFPIAQQEGSGHVINELKLNNEKLDYDFVLSKSNINIISKNDIKPNKIKLEKRLDLSNQNSYMLKSWEGDNYPILPLIQIEKEGEKNFKLWIHTTSIAERFDINDKKILELFFDQFESIPMLKNWNSYLGENINKVSTFNIGKNNEAISLCINLNKDYEIIDWSFYLTIVKCTCILNNSHIEALLTRKSKTRITSRILKPIKEYISDLDKILEISNVFRNRQVADGKIEIPSSENKIESLYELFVHNPAEYSKEYLEPLNDKDCQTHLSPILFEANQIWFKHSYNYGLKSAGFKSQNLDDINVSEIIKYSELVESELALNEDGNISLSQLISLSNSDKNKRILFKLIVNMLNDNELFLIENNNDINEEKEIIISPWTLPSFDFINLLNQYSILNMIINGKRSSKSNKKEINIMQNNSWNDVNWKLYTPSIFKDIDILFNKFVIDKINEYKDKAKKYKENMISIKQVREAEKLLGCIYSGFIVSVQNYGFFVEIQELKVEGLVHVSTLNNDWYEYRSRQNLLIGRKSKKSYKIGDSIKVKIIKVDILKYQIDLELT